MIAALRITWTLKDTHLLDAAALIVARKWQRNMSIPVGIINAKGVSRRRVAGNGPLNIRRKLYIGGSVYKQKGEGEWAG